MKLAATTVALYLAASANAFAPSPSTFVRRSTCVNMGFDLSGNTWQPDSEKMGSTDTGDYFPDNYDPEAEIAFSSGMMGSQEMLTGGDRGGPQLPGLENVGADAVITGGIEMSSEIPPGMDFTPNPFYNGEYDFQAPSSGQGSLTIPVNPVTMTFEDYYAAFAPGSHPSLSVAPVTGRMDRRGGEPTILEVTCQPNGQGGEFQGDLVINLPDDGSKICYKITARAL